MCGSLKDKLFHATKDNTTLKQEVSYLASRLERTILSEKMTEEDLSRVDESATKSTYKLGVGFERYKNKSEKSALKFIPSSNYHKKEEALKPTKTHYPSNPKPSFNPKRGVKKETPSRDRKLLFACFVTMLVTWISFASDARVLRRGTLSMLETHIAMSSLIFRLVLIVVLRLTLLLVICLICLTDLTIAHMILIHERIALCLDALVTAHILIVVIIHHVGMVFLLEGLTLTLSPDTWTVLAFPILVHVPLDQRVRCKRL
jgi:hypothetical protein